MTNYNTTSGKESEVKTKYQNQRNDMFYKPEVISLTWLSEDISNWYIIFQELNEAPQKVKVGMLVSISGELDLIFLVICKLQSRKTPPTGEVAHKGTARIDEVPGSIFPSRVNMEIKQEKQNILFVFFILIEGLQVNISVAIPAPANLSFFGFIDVNLLLSFAADTQPASSCAEHGHPSPLLLAGFTRYNGYLIENWIFSTEDKNKENSHNL